MTWDVNQYEKFRDERARPFADLMARVPPVAAREVVDLGCGTGELTGTLIERFPGARVTGVDRSPEMLAAAAPRAAAGQLGGRLAFEHGDVATWAPPAPVDVLVSNATLHWLPDHERLVPRLAAHVAPRGVLAWQMPDNSREPSHRELRAMLAEPRWARVRDAVPPGTRAPVFYATALAALGFEVDVWETTYLHLLAGEGAVLEWVKGATLAGLVAALDERERAAFLGEYGARLAAAYAPGPAGTPFPFRRVFVVARRGEC